MWEFNRIKNPKQEPEIEGLSGLRLMHLRLMHVQIVKSQRCLIDFVHLVGTTKVQRLWLLSRYNFTNKRARLG